MKLGCLKCSGDGALAKAGLKKAKYFAEINRKGKRGRGK